MNWFILIVAGCFEVGFAFCLEKAKISAGIIAFWWYAGFIIALTISMVLLIKAIKTIPIGTAYAVWTGIGAVGTALIGIVFFKEPITPIRSLLIATLIASIVGLQYTSK